MSEHDFHVHGVEEHEVEHHAMAGHTLSQWVAVFSAVLSSLGAVISYQSGATLNDAMLQKNEAVLKKARATDLWNFYQAKSVKGHLLETAVESAPPEKKEHYRREVERYNAERGDIRRQAEALDKESEEADRQSAHHLHPHHQQAQAMVMVQIGISLASITALTRRTWLFAAAAVAAVVGITTWVWSMLG